MADSITLNSMSGGSVVDTEVPTYRGNHIQRMKIAVGAVDSDAGDATTVNPLPVLITNLTVSGTTISGMPGLNFPTIQTVNVQNMPVVTTISGGIGQLITQQANLSAGSLNADLVASTDVSQYKSWSLQITGPFSGTLTFQGSNDNTNWISVQAADCGAANGSLTTTVGGGNLSIYIGVIGYKYLRVRMTSYSSGTANGTLELHTLPIELHYKGVNAAQYSNPWHINIADVGGQPFSIGQQVMANSMPIVVANGQTVAVSGIMTSVSGTMHSVVDNFPTTQIANQGAPAPQSQRWPTYLSDGNNPVGTPTNPLTVSGVMDIVANTPTMVSGIGTAVWQIKNTAAILDSYYIYNPNSSVMYLQLFDVAAAGSVTLGTTAPKQSYGIPATSAANLATIALQFKNGLFIAATTTAGGSTGPTTGLDVNLGFK